LRRDNFSSEQLCDGKTSWQCQVTKFLSFCLVFLISSARYHSTTFSAIGTRTMSWLSSGLQKITTFISGNQNAKQNNKKRRRGSDEGDGFGFFRKRRKISNFDLDTNLVLPHEIILMILELLHPRDLQACSEVCKYWLDCSREVGSWIWLDSTLYYAFGTCTESPTFKEVMELRISRRAEEKETGTKLPRKKLVLTACFVTVDTQSRRIDWPSIYRYSIRSRS
jgi:hypothetical protein